MKKKNRASGISIGTVLIVISGLLIAGLVWMFGISPVNSDREQIQEATAQNNKDITEFARRLTAVSGNGVDEAGDIYRQLVVVSGRVAGQSVTTGGVYQTVAGSAVSSGVTITAFVVDQAATTNRESAGMSYVAAKVSASGDPAALLRWASALQAQNQLVTVVNPTLTISKTKEGESGSLSMDLRIWFSPNPLGGAKPSTTASGAPTPAPNSSTSAPVGTASPSIPAASGSSANASTSPAPSPGLAIPSDAPSSAPVPQTLPSASPSGS